MSSPDSNPRYRVIPLDGIRGFACLLIIVFHSALFLLVRKVPVACWNLIELGRWSLDFFFVLSGYLITGVLLDAKGQKSYFKNFYSRRFLRVFPLYYLLVVLLVFIAPRLPLPGVVALEGAERLAKAGPWLLLYGYNFFLFRLNDWFHIMIDAMWSLSVEEQFYLVWPLVVRFLSLTRLKVLCVALIAAALAVRSSLYFTHHSYLQIFVLTPARMDSIAFGALAALLARTDFRIRGSAVLIGLRVTAILLAGAWIALYEPWDPFRSDWSQSALIFTVVNAFLAVLLLLAVLEPSRCAVPRLFSLPLLTHFGKYSYAIYLFHEPACLFFGNIFLRDMRWKPTGHAATAFQLAFTAAVLVSTYAVARISWRFIEAPCLRLKKHFAHPERFNVP